MVYTCTPGQCRPEAWHTTPTWQKQSGQCHSLSWPGSCFTESAARAHLPGSFCESVTPSSSKDAALGASPRMNPKKLLCRGPAPSKESSLCTPSARQAASPDQLAQRSQKEPSPPAHDPRND